MPHHLQLHRVLPREIEVTRLVSEVKNAVAMGGLELRR